MCVCYIYVCIYFNISFSLLFFPASWLFALSASRAGQAQRTLATIKRVFFYPTDQRLKSHMVRRGSERPVQRSGFTVGKFISGIDQSVSVCSSLFTLARCHC